MKNIVVLTDVRMAEARLAGEYLAGQGWRVETVPKDICLWDEAALSAWAEPLAGEIAGVSVPETTGKEETVMVSCKVLRKGSTGSAVKKLQILLNGLGYSCGTVDGDFGGKTRAAVVAYQKAQGLAQDGVVGAATWGRLIG